MINRSMVAFSSLGVVVALTLCSTSMIARGSNQKHGQQTESSLMTKGSGIPDVDVVLKKKLGGGSAGNTRTDKEGRFYFENVPFGTYNLTFDAPKLSPAKAGKVEYLVIVQQFAVGGADSSTAKTYTDSKSNTVKRIAIAKTKEGFDFTVGPQHQAGTKEDRLPTGPENINVRGKILLVEVGTNNIVIDEAGVKATRAAQDAAKWAPFVELSRQGVCSDLRNRLFVIDQAHVFADQAGDCPDARYSHVLYGKTVDDVLCEHRDNKGGARKSCKNPSYEGLFDTIITHLNEPDLGLGPNHTVQQLLLSKRRRGER